MSVKNRGWRAAWRGGFDDDADSIAGDHDVDIHGGLRGVRLAVAPQERTLENQVHS